MDFPIFSTITKKALRSNFEKTHYAIAPITFTLGLIISLLIFPLPIAYTSITILTIGDSVANISGRIFGKTPIFYNKNKTIEGTIIGSLTAFLGSILFVNPSQALIAVSIGMFVESLPLPTNDNLAIPLSSGTILILMSIF
ncbi:MAG: phosphatidate cytidylyltransferase [Candidatus Bathyarchaeota archaeon]